VHAYREEFRALYAHGCRNIQFDDPTFAFYCADSTLEGMKKAGVDSEKLFDTYIRVYNEILKDRPADLTVGLHTCRGNYKVCSNCLRSLSVCIALYACRVLMYFVHTDVRACTTAKEATTVLRRNYSTISTWTAIT
jgi:methionine synthase II (cobalamin-independent)